MMLVKEGEEEMARVGKEEAGVLANLSLTT
jgi:hypothetical protein